MNVTWFNWIKTSQPLFLLCVGLLGLIIGSFLNVVIYRLPKILHREWIKQCYSYLQDNAKSLPLLTTYYPSPTDNERFNLVFPRSHCPYCKHQLTALENIPILSFIFLKGRCSACGNPISWRYPLVEILSAIFSILVAYQFGWSWQTLSVLILTWSLIAVAFIDLDHQIIPDHIVFPLLWLGLVFNVQSTFVPLSDAIVGVIFGYLFLWSVYWIFKLITGKEGMGYGDFKLLAMFGAWLGYRALPMIILFASIAGALIGIILILLKRHQRSALIPFGPFLAAAGWITLMWMDPLITLYKDLLHLP